MSELASNIKRLREQGLTYDQIQAELGCSKGTISYHLGVGQKEKSRDRQQKLRSSVEGSITKKVYGFHFEKEKRPRPPAKVEKIPSRVASDKVRGFCRSPYPESKRINYEFTYEDVINKFAGSEICYLTGESLDLSKPSSYEFDHITPRSRGGDNSLDNMGLTTKEANRLKGTLTVEELLGLCEKVLKNFGRM